MYFDKVLMLRTSNELKKKVCAILRHYPDKFESEAHVWRAALNSFYYRKIIQKRKEFGDEQ